jgi:mRNA-degrading endonuclease toxin of MazEF toxin-antitoxin module
VPIPAGAGGLAKEGTALCHQITTLDRAKLHRRLGALPEAQMAAVDEGLNVALDLP